MFISKSFLMKISATEVEHLLVLTVWLWASMRIDFSRVEPKKIGFDTLLHRVYWLSNIMWRDRME